jgi:hypothetical protein
VTVTANATADQLIVDESGMFMNSEGTLTIHNGPGTDLIMKGIWNSSSTVAFSDGATGEISGFAFCQVGGIMTIGSNGASVTIDNNGLFENDGGDVTTTAGAWIVNNGGSYRHNLDGGLLPLATWDAGSNCQITGVVATIPGNLNQTFSNFAWSCASQYGKVNAADNLKTINGDFTMTSTGTGSLKFSSFGLNQAMTIGGNYYQYGGKILFTEIGNWKVNISGNFNITAGSIIMTDGRTSTGEGNPWLSVSGVATISDGLIDMSQYTASTPGKGIGTITFNGNVNYTGGTITSTSIGSGYGTINFSKTGTQAFSGNASFGNKVDINVTNSTTLSLGTNILRGGRNFFLAAGGGLILGDLNGITYSDFEGNIQMRGMRSFSPAANYTYSGSVAQVTGDGIPSLVNNLTVINPSDLTLSKSVIVSSVLTMTSGNIHTLLDTLGLGIKNTNPGTLVRTTSTVIGWFKRWIAGNTTAGYLFPISYDSHYRAVDVNYTNAPSTGGYITVHYAPSDPGILGLPVQDAGTTIIDVGHEGYWNVAAERQLTNGSYNIDINANDYFGMTDYTKLHILRRTDSESAWTLSGSHSATTGSGNNPVSHRSSINGASYGQFAIAGGKFYPVPVQLISFDAKPAGSIVKLDWATTNEVNNDFFTTERSVDGIDFIPLKDIDGAGNSASILTYHSTDDKPLSGINYYRLKQTDYDDNSSYSPVKIVRFDISNSDNVIAIESVLPNPFLEGFILNYTALRDGRVNLTLKNSAGAIIKKEKLMAIKGVNSYEFVENINLAAGVYYVSLSMNNKEVTKKIIKNS